MDCAGLLFCVMMIAIWIVEWREERSLRRHRPRRRSPRGAGDIVPVEGTLPPFSSTPCRDFLFSKWGFLSLARSGELMDNYPN